MRDYDEFLKTFMSDKFKKLRSGQAFVLNQYSESFCNFNKHSDIAIELPTGAGKSLISLLIGEEWRQEGYKVAILTANKTLARQMQKEAGELGIPSVLMEGRGVDIPSKDKRSYHRHTKIAIMNYWVYFNQRPVVDPADLLIMDDAHLAEHCLHSLYSFEVDKSDHSDLFIKIVQELANRFPEYSVLHDALDESAPQNTPPELFSFIDQVSFYSRFRELVDSSSELTSDKDLKFRWGRLRNSLNECNIYLGQNSIWVKPYIYPLADNSQWVDAKQRLYMSATIGDPNDLCRRLGVRNIEKIPVPNELSNITSGRRLIIMNHIEEADIPRRLQVAILEALRVHPKSVWMCTSKKEAEKYRDAVTKWLGNNGFRDHPTWILTNLGDEIDQFKESSVGHLFVAGRFDGMDFKEEECRLVVLATVPRAINLQEEFFCAYLRDSGFMSKRLNQRIIQALGRCNREDSDFGMYVLAERRFATHFGRESNRKGIPKNIIAEIDMAEDATEDSEKDLQGSVSDFLHGNFDSYDKKLQEALEGVLDIDSARNDMAASDEVLGWIALFSNKNYRLAVEKFDVCYQKAREQKLVELGAFYGWCWAKALYLEGINGDLVQKERALQILEQAVVRGGQSSWFNRMRCSLNRAKKSATSDTPTPIENCAATILQRFDQHLETLGSKGTRYQKWANRIQYYIESESHNEFQKGLEQLGTLLGYNATLPRHGAATDCRWRGVFGNSKEVVTFEAKIEHEADGAIIPGAVGQAHNQMHRAISEFQQYGYSVRGTIVTHLEKIDPSAKSSAGNIKIISKKAIFLLWQRVLYLLTRYRDGWSLDDINLRRITATEIKTYLPSDGWLIRTLDHDQLWIDDKMFFAEWPDL